MTISQKTVTVERKRDTLIVIPQGDAVGFRTTEVQKEFLAVVELLDSSDVAGVVVDLGQASYFGSLVIGRIIELANKIRSQGGRIALCRVSDQMREFLSVMKLQDLLPQYASRKQALAAVEK